MSKAQARARAVELMERVRIPAAAERLDDYPHQFSGGMRQRVMIAMALACSPQRADRRRAHHRARRHHPGPGAGAAGRLQKQEGLAVLLITHDLGVVAVGRRPGRWSCMAATSWRARPCAPSSRPRRTPTARRLLAAMPRVDRSIPLAPIPGQVPTLPDMPAGCRFQSRCPLRFDKCAEKPPRAPCPPIRSMACAAGRRRRHDGRGPHRRPAPAGAATCPRPSQPPRLARRQDGGGAGGRPRVLRGRPRRGARRRRRVRLRQVDGGAARPAAHRGRRRRRRLRRRAGAEASKGDLAACAGACRSSSRTPPRRSILASAWARRWAKRCACTASPRRRDVRTVWSACWTRSGCPRSPPTGSRTSSPAASASASASRARWRWGPTSSSADEPVSALDVSVQAQILVRWSG